MLNPKGERGHSDIGTKERTNHGLTDSGAGLLCLHPTGFSLSPVVPVYEKQGVFVCMRKRLKTAVA